MTAGLMHGEVRGLSDEELFAPFELLADDANWQEMEKKTTPKHTAQRLKLHDPIKYETLRRTLAEFQGISKTARAHKVGVNTLYAIIEADLGGLNKYNTDLAKQFKRAAHMCVEKVIELAPDVKDFMQAGIVAGIMAQRSQELSGGPQLVIEHRHVDSGGVQKLQAMLDEARAKMATRIVSGRIVESDGSGSESADAGRELVTSNREAVTV